MKEEQNDFDKAVTEWRRKHGIRDNDPLLAATELLKLFFQNVKIEVPPDSESATFAVVRATLQNLNKLGKEFYKEARELTQEIRSVPKLEKELSAGRAIAFLCTAISALVAGVLIGKFLF